MKISELNHKSEVDTNSKFKESFIQFEKLLSEIRKKEVPDAIVVSINKDIDELNSISAPANEWLKILKKKQAGIIKLLEKELKWVPKKHYTKIWMAVGMAAFGLPLGVVFGTSLGNMSFLAIGLPIGMAIGMGVGAGMDKNAFEGGRQLDIEIKS